MYTTFPFCLSDHDRLVAGIKLRYMLKGIVAVTGEVTRF